jgi:hypothetical protein
MQREDEIRERTNCINQRAALRTSLEFLGLRDAVPLDSLTIAGQARTAFLREVAGHTADAFQKGKVMPDGFTLTVCYGEQSLLPRIRGWMALIKPEASYVFGFDRVHGALKLSDSFDSALMKVDGRRLGQIVEHLRHGAEEDGSRWPFEVIWVEGSFATGAAFSEYAGTPHIPNGDDKRIFEISCW